jgi:hypothetical protein
MGEEYTKVIRPYTITACAKGTPTHYYKIIVGRSLVHVVLGNRKHTGFLEARKVMNKWHLNGTKAVYLVQWPNTAPM